MRTGDRLLVIGPSTGVVELTAMEIRVDLKQVESASKGEYCSIPVDLGGQTEKLRRSDKVYIWQ